MPKTKISEFSAIPGNNTDIDGINIAEGCPPSGINDAIRELMSQLKDFQAGTAGDSFNGPIGTTTPAAGVFTNLSASGTFALTGDQVQISEGGTGQTTANAAFNALAPSQSTHAGKYLKTDGTNTSWDALDISTADITGTLPIANGGTGLTALGTGVQTALGIAVGSSGAFVTNGGALGTPSSGTVTNLTGTASININGTVGATTPTTGAFTTLSASGNITVSGGTANGVAYLNGSKVLTTGSALSFNGTRFTTYVTSDTNTNIARFGVVNTAITDDAFLDISADAANNLITLNSTGNNAGSFAFQTGGSEQMRLTSTGLGIGTSSPAAKLHVSLAGAGALILENTGNNGVYARWKRPNREYYLALDINNNGGNDFSLYDATAAATRWTVDSSGNLGIGTSSPSYRLDVSSASTPVARFTGAANAYVDFTDGTVTSRLQNSGALLFGTTSNHSLLLRTNSTTQATLDTSGNLGMVNAPSTWGSAARAIQIWGGASYGYNSNDGGTFLGSNFFYNSSNLTAYVATAAASAYYQVGGQHRWYQVGSGTAGTTFSFTQAMTLDASGQLMVGGTNPDGQFTVDNATTPYMSIRRAGSTVLYFGSANTLVSGGSTADGAIRAQSNLVFATGGNTERARITSGGDLLVGTTTTGLTPASGFGFNASQYLSIGHANGVATGTEYISFAYNSTKIGSITQNGTTGVLYNITSDYRLKNVVGAVTGSGARIDALLPVDYTWKADGSAARGFLAHEFQAVYPNSVTGTKDAVDAEGKPVYQQMQASTTEVIADLVAEIQSLRARVAQLEAK